MKLWFVIRSYGVEGLKAYVRRHAGLARHFESLVLKDKRFEVCNEVQLGLVCFRLRGPNELTVQLLEAITESQRLFMIPAMLKGRYVIRFCICSEHCTRQDVAYAWNAIREPVEAILVDMKQRTTLVGLGGGVSSQCLTVCQGVQHIEDVEEDEVFASTAATSPLRPGFNRMLSDPGYLSCQLLTPPLAPPGCRKQLSVTSTT